MEKTRVIAHPVRVIPFDLGRPLEEKDIEQIHTYVAENFREKELTKRAASILKNCCCSFRINDKLSAYVYFNGICVTVIREKEIEYSQDYAHFAIAYGENRKAAHTALFAWLHSESATIEKMIDRLRKIVHNRTKDKKSLRRSGFGDFENRGLSYIMTLSAFCIEPGIVGYRGFREYPQWLKSNIIALLDPSVLYLEDSSRFQMTEAMEFNARHILENLDVETDLKDYERHLHLDTFMSWAAVVLVGQIQESDFDEYTALEIQLQSDWYYVYCLEKELDFVASSSKNAILALQRQSYEIDIMENRIFDFDDSSMPSRILDIQRGLVNTSGLMDNISHFQRKIKYLLERARLETEVRQKHLGQSSEILLFIIAFIEIAPTVAQYGENLFPHAGVIANCLIVILGIILFLRKN